MVVSHAANDINVVFTSLLLIIFVPAVFVEDVRMSSATIGHDVELLCKPAMAKDVVWEFHNPLTIEPIELASYGEVTSSFSCRMSLSRSTSLRINETNALDAGLYSCIEDNGIGTKHFTLLKVLGHSSNEEEDWSATTTSETKSQATSDPNFGFATNKSVQTETAESIQTCTATEKLGAVYFLSIVAGVELLVLIVCVMRCRLRLQPQSLRCFGDKSSTQYPEKETSESAYRREFTSSEKSTHAMTIVETE